MEVSTEAVAPAMVVVEDVAAEAVVAEEDAEGAVAVSIIITGHTEKTLTGRNNLSLMTC